VTALTRALELAQAAAESYRAQLTHTPQLTKPTANPLMACPYPAATITQPGRCYPTTEPTVPKATLATARAELEQAEPSTPPGCSLRVEAGCEPGAELLATVRTGNEEHAA